MGATGNESKSQGGILLILHVFCTQIRTAKEAERSGDGRLQQRSIHVASPTFPCGEGKGSNHYDFISYSISHTSYMLIFLHSPFLPSFSSLALYVSIFLYLSVRLSLCLAISLSISISLTLSLSLSISVSLPPLSLSLPPSSMSPFLPLFYLNLSSIS